MDLPHVSIDTARKCKFQGEVLILINEIIYDIYQQIIIVYVQHNQHLRQEQPYHLPAVKL